MGVSTGRALSEVQFRGLIHRSVGLQYCKRVTSFVKCKRGMKVSATNMQRPEIRVFYSFEMR